MYFFLSSQKRTQAFHHQRWHLVMLVRHFLKIGTHMHYTEILPISGSLWPQNRRENGVGVCVQRDISKLTSSFLHLAVKRNPVILGKFSLFVIQGPQRYLKVFSHSDCHRTKLPWERKLLELNCVYALFVYLYSKDVKHRQRDAYPLGNCKQ